MHNEADQTSCVSVTASRPDPYILEEKRSRLVWKSFLRSTGSLGQRWLRRKVRQDWTCHAMAPGVDLITFWLDAEIGGGGTGPCMSVFCLGHEVLRFDCFGGREGHFHIAPFTPWTLLESKGHRRLQFRGESAREQIEHALFEITENLDFYLQLNPRRQIRRIRINRENRVQACTSARLRLLHHLENVPQLQALNGT